MKKYRNYIIGYISTTRKKYQNFLERELKEHNIENHSSFSWFYIICFI